MSIADEEYSSGSFGIGDTRFSNDTVVYDFVEITPLP
jgi:hypothetical protein